MQALRAHPQRETLPKLRAAAHVQRPAPEDAPPLVGTEVALLVLSPEPGAGPALTAALAGLDPYGALAVDLKDGEHAVIIAGGNGAEHALTLPNQHPALTAFQRRLRQARGRHLIMVADLDSATGAGQVYGLFECHQPPAPRPAARRPTGKKSPKKRR